MDGRDGVPGVELVLDAQSGISCQLSSEESMLVRPISLHRVSVEHVFLRHVEFMRTIRRNTFCKISRARSVGEFGTEVAICISAPSSISVGRVCTSLQQNSDESGTPLRMTTSSEPFRTTGCGRSRLWPLPTDPRWACLLCLSPMMLAIEVNGEYRASSEVA